jgi:minor extracellular serine protease Vpr
MRFSQSFSLGLQVKCVIIIVIALLCLQQYTHAAVLNRAPSHFIVRAQPIFQFLKQLIPTKRGQNVKVLNTTTPNNYTTVETPEVEGSIILGSEEAEEAEAESAANNGRVAGHYYVLANGYIVEFNAAPGTTKAQEEKEAFIAAMNELNIEWGIRYTFDTLMNGMSVVIPGAYVDIMLALPMVKQAWSLAANNQPKMSTKVGSRDRSLQAALNSTGVDMLHREGYFGQGIRVGILDSGIDYRHPAFGGCYGNNDPNSKCRVAFGYDFVGDKYDGKTQPPQEDDDPLDTCNGHGTHVAGVVGADSSILRGVAPKVILGAYRILGCAGYVDDDIVIAAMERAVKDGMDIVNMSIGSGSAWAQSPLSLVASRMVDRGIVVVAAGGNDGNMGLWQVAAPSIGKNVISVASVDNYEYRAYGIRTSTGENIDYWREDFEKIHLNKSKLVLARDPSTMLLDDDDAINDTDSDASGNIDNTGCSPLSSHVEGNVVLVERGGCTFTDKVRNAYEAGATAVLIYNNEFGLVNPVSDDNSIPYAGLSQDNGHKLVDLIETQLQKAALTISSENGNNSYPYIEIEFLNEPQQYPNPTGGSLSSYSSWGIGPDLELKPDIGAPGGLVLSTFPMNLGEYATLSGTSMASPYIAGAAALMLEYNKRKGTKIDPKTLLDKFQLTSRPAVAFGASPITIEDWVPGNQFLVNTRTRMDRSWNKFINFFGNFRNYFKPITVSHEPFVPVARQGAGLVNVYNAAKLEFSASPARLELNATTTDTAIKRVIRIENNGNSRAIVHVRHHAALAVNGYQDDFDLLPEPVTAARSARVSFDNVYFVLEARSQKSITVTFHRPSGLPDNELWIYSGFITLQIQKPGWTLAQVGMLSVPYVGVSGDYRSLPVLTPPGYGLPMIRAADTGTAWTKSTQTTRAFTFYDRDYPRIGIRLEHLTSKLYIHAAEVDGTLIGPIPSGTNQFIGRNDLSNENMISYLPWDGQALPISKAKFSDQFLTATVPTSSRPTYLPDGQYRIHIAALRPFGNPHKAADYDTWLSPIIPINATGKL